MPRTAPPRPPTAEPLEPRTLLAVLIDPTHTQLPPASPAAAPLLPTPRITLDYRFDATRFFDAPERRGALQHAADAAVRLLGDYLYPVAVSGSYHWDATFEDPATGQPASLRNLPVGVSEIVLFPGSRELDGGPGDTPGEGPVTPGDPLSRGSRIVPVAVADPPNPFLDLTAWQHILLHREQFRPDAPAEGHAPWGGSLSFDPTPALPWHFDPSAPPAAGAYDFPTAATRAVAQVLGFGTTARWTNWVTDAGFRGAEAIRFNQGGGDDVPVPVDPTGRFFADTDDPGAPASALRATLLPGRRSDLSPLDYAALRDLGWSTRRRVALVPPASQPADAAGPVRFDVVYESAEAHWAPTDVVVYPPLTYSQLGSAMVPHRPPPVAPAVVDTTVLGPTAQRVTYVYTPLGGRWDANQFGPHAVVIRNHPEAGTIGSFSIDPGTPPTAHLQTWAITVPGAAPHRLNVNFNDNQSLDSAAMAADDVVVTDPRGVEVAVAASPLTFNNPVSSTTRDFFAQPPGGSWGPEDNGTYTVSLRPGRLRDSAGNVAPGAPFGTFEVAINASTSRRTVLRAAQNGATVTVTLSGPGSIKVYPAVVNGSDVGRIELDGTTLASTLSIRGPRGSYVNAIVATGSLGAINAPDVMLDGDLTVAGGLRRLKLRSNGSENTIAVGPGPGLSVSIGRAGRLTLDSASPIRSIVVGEWTRFDAARPSRITAPSIGSITATFPGSRFEADVTTGSLGAARFAGDLSLSTFRVAEKIGPISAGSISATRIFAGLPDTSVALPTSVADFTNPAASIASLTVRHDFTTSLVAAPQIGRVSLSSILLPVTSDPLPFGVAADTVKFAHIAATTDLPFRAAHLEVPTADHKYGNFILDVL